MVPVNASFSSSVIMSDVEEIPVLIVGVLSIGLIVVLGVAVLRIAT